MKKLRTVLLCAGVCLCLIIGLVVSLLSVRQQVLIREITSASGQTENHSGTIESDAVRIEDRQELSSQKLEVLSPEMSVASDEDNPGKQRSIEPTDDMPKLVHLPTREQMLDQWAKEKLEFSVGSYDMSFGRIRARMLVKAMVGVESLFWLVKGDTDAETTWAVANVALEAGDLKTAEKYLHLTAEKETRPERLCEIKQRLAWLSDDPAEAQQLLEESVNLWTVADTNPKLSSAIWYCHITGNEELEEHYLERFWRENPEYAGRTTNTYPKSWQKNGN
jgi:hypothetical protein